MMKSSHYIILGLAIGIILVGIAGTAWIQQPYEYTGSLLETPMQLNDFELIDQHGQPVRLSEITSGDQDVKAVLVFFGYTHCPDVCPITLTEFKRVKQKLGDQGDQVRFVFITVDPERDTPEVLREHLANFDPEFIGLTGDQAALEKIWDQLGIYQEKQDTGSAAGYLMAHTASIFLIDENEALRMTFPYGMETEAITADVSHLLKE